MTRPDWVPEALWEKAERIAQFCDAGIGYRSEALAEHAFGLVTTTIALALLSAKNEGKREAAEIVQRTGNFGDYRLCELTVIGQAKFKFMNEISRAILSSIQKEPK